MRTPASIVLAAYNGQDYLAEQLDSILAQMQPDDELIISADPSGDATRAIAWDYAEKDGRIRVLEGPGKGVIANFEAALGNTRHDIIFLADQDDIWLSGKMDAMIQAFEDPDVLAAVHDCIVTDKALHPIEDSFFKSHPVRRGFWDNVIRNGFTGCCMAVSRPLLERALPFPEGIPMHDSYLGLLALKTGKVAWIETPFLLWRRHGGNATGFHKNSLAVQLGQRKALLSAVQKRAKRKQ